MLWAEENVRLLIARGAWKRGSEPLLGLQSHWPRSTRSPKSMLPWLL